jgi:hypothetical protein
MALSQNSLACDTLPLFGGTQTRRQLGSLAPPSSAFPAKAGIQSVDYRPCDRVWVPPREGGDFAGNAAEGEAGGFTIFATPPVIGPLDPGP